MSVLDLKITENIGLVKELDENSVDIIFTNLQESQYSFPIKSFIREVFSNGIDSIIEKTSADSILNKNESVEDYYIHRTEDSVKDSNFDSSYYDFNFLNLTGTGDSVSISYYVREDELKDLITITDYGVGLSSKRLRNYTKLGWSSKRNSKLPIGRFGIGAKAGLSTGASFFTMQTFYNGYETTLMIYRDHFHCITVPSEDYKEEIWSGKSKDDKDITIPIIWNVTERPNGAIVSLEVSKYVKDKYISAVKDQLMYFKDKVNLFIHENNNTEELKFIPNFLYESDNCIIPERSIYSEPHITISNVNYGVIPWDEIGMEKRWGKLAIKGSASDLDINQSRETIVWTEKSGKAVRKYIEHVSDNAKEYLESKMEDTDNLIDWVNLVGKIEGSSRNDVVLAQFGKFLPKSNLHFKWSIKSHYKNIKVINYPRVHVTEISRTSNDFNYLFEAFNLTKVSVYTRTQSQSASKLIETHKLNTDTVYSWQGFQDVTTIVYAKDTAINTTVARYILDTYSSNYFIYIREMSESAKESRNIQSDTLALTWDIIKTYGIDLDSLEIPKEFTDKIKKKEDEQKQVEVQEQINNKELKKKYKSEILTYKPFVCNYREFKDNFELNYNVSFYWQLIRKGYTETKYIKLIDDYDYIIYSDSTEDSIKLMSVIKYFLVASGIIGTHSILICTVSKESAKILTQYSKAINILNFIMEKEKDKITLHELFRDYNTAKRFGELLAENPSLRYLHLIDTIDDRFSSITDKWSIYSKVPTNMHKGIEALCGRDDEYRKSILGAYTILNDFLNNTEAVNRLQYEGKHEEALQKCKEYFNSDIPLTISAIDIEFISIVEEIVERLQKVNPILNNLKYEELGDSREDGKLIGELLSSIL